MPDRVWLKPVFSEAAAKSSVLEAYWLPSLALTMKELESDDTQPGTSTVLPRVPSEYGMTWLPPVELLTTPTPAPMPTVRVLTSLAVVVVEPGL